jgi:DNA-binding NtrC family response regulator
MKILLTFTGFHDPYTIGLVGNEEVPGPILSLVKNMHFDKTILFSTPNTTDITTQTVETLQRLAPKMIVERADLPLADPTDYLPILRYLRKYFTGIANSADGSEFFISVASGTPQMHACWLLLVASGEIPAQILHTRPPRFVTNDRPLVSKVDLSSPEFPVVTPNVFSFDVSEPRLPNLDESLRELEIIGDHPSMKKAIDGAAVLATANVPVLILGETGTGKDLFSKLIHRLSDRSRNAFVPINCAAISRELVESTLFGHRKGAFTGANADQIGRFDVADHGVLFLDELGELPIPAQSKLLRVVEDGVIEPLGATKTHKVDVRIIAATNQDMKEAIKSGRFRDDLYFRLNRGEIKLPPLRERRSDIPKIALHILDRVNASAKYPKRLSRDAIKKLQGHSWPGNARDLRNVLERSVLFAKKPILEPDDLVFNNVIEEELNPSLPEPSEGFSLEEYLADVRDKLIRKSLEIANGNQSEAARLLGVSPQAVNKFIKRNTNKFKPG